MRLGLLAMSGVRVIDPELAWLGVTLPQFVARGHVVASLPSLSLLTLAALTPEDVEIEYVEIPHIADLNARRLPDFDAVAISSYSAQIGEAYALADQLRGPRDEGDSRRAARDGPAARGPGTRRRGGAGRGRAPLAAGDRRPGPRPLGAHLSRARPARSTTCGNRPSRGSACWTRRTTTASPSRPRAAARTSCEFCAGSRLYGPGYRQKTVDQVLAEIRAVGEIWERPFLEFADDNLFVDRRWGRELLERLRPLGARWFAETDISVADDPDLLRGPPPGRLLPASDRAGEPFPRQSRGGRGDRLEGRPAGSLRPRRPHDPGRRGDGQHLFHRRAGPRHGGGFRRHPPLRPPRPSRWRSR